MSRTVIAIDGPAGAGKSTVSRLVASRLGLGYVDTGATYRLVALEALRRSMPLDDGPAVAKLARETMARARLADGARLRFDDADVGDEIRTPEVSRSASIVAAHPEVRTVLVDEQRRLVPTRGAVVEGRDIGTVVWPEAELKVYLDASSDVRAGRREAQHVTAGTDASALAVEVHERDERDATRAISAMRAAPDAVVLDTSELSAEAVAGRIVDLLKPKRRSPVYAIVRAILAVLLRTAFRLEVRGAENIPKHGGAIIAPNHRSLIDHPTVGVATKRQIWFMAKSELFRNKWAAKFLYAMNSFPVNRGRPDRASLQRCLELLEQGELVGIYPAGTRTPESRFEDLEDGFTYIALKSGVPIVPVAVSGTESVLPRGRRFPKFVKIKVLIGEPFRLGERHAGVLPRGKIREATAEAKLRLDAVMDELEPRRPK
jgi:cytidylate kinase